MVYFACDSVAHWSTETIMLTAQHHFLLKFWCHINLCIHLLRSSDHYCFYPLFCHTLHWSTDVHGANAMLFRTQLRLFNLCQLHVPSWLAKLQINYSKVSLATYYWYIILQPSKFKLIHSGKSRWRNAYCSLNLNARYKSVFLHWWRHFAWPYGNVRCTIGRLHNQPIGVTLTIT